MPKVGRTALAAVMAALTADAIYPTRSDGSILAQLSFAVLLTSKLSFYLVLVAHVTHYRMFTLGFDSVLLAVTRPVFGPPPDGGTTSTFETYLGFIVGRLFPWHSLLVFLSLSVPMLSSEEAALHYLLGAVFVFITYDCGKVHTKDPSFLVLLNFHHLGAVIAFLYATQFRDNSTRGEMWHNAALYSWLWFSHAFRVVHKVYRATLSGITALAAPLTRSTVATRLLARLPFSKRAPTPPPTEKPKEKASESKGFSMAMEAFRHVYACVAVYLFYLHFTDEGQPKLDGSTYQTYSVGMMLLGRLLTNDNFISVPFLKHVEAPGYVLVALWLLYEQQRFATAVATLVCVASFVAWKTRPRTATPEPEPLPFDESASQLVLVAKDVDPTSPDCSALVFANAASLKRHEETLLTLASHPGKAVVPKNGTPLGPFTVHGNAWLVVGLGVGDASVAVRCVLDAGGFLVRTHDERCLDIAWWKYEPFNTLHLINEMYSKAKTKIGGGGRSFVCNEDGTVSPRYAPHLVLGVKLPAAAAASSPRRSSPRRPRPQGKDKSA